MIRAFFTWRVCGTLETGFGMVNPYTLMAWENTACSIEIRCLIVRSEYTDFWEIDLMISAVVIWHNRLLAIPSKNYGTRDSAYFVESLNDCLSLITSGTNSLSVMFTKSLDDGTKLFFKSSYSRSPATLANCFVFRPCFDF